MFSIWSVRVRYTILPISVAYITCIKTPEKADMLKHSQTYSVLMPICSITSWSMFAAVFIRVPPPTKLPSPYARPEYNFRRLCIIGMEINTMRMRAEVIYVLAPTIFHVAHTQLMTKVHSAGIFRHLELKGDSIAFKLANTNLVSPVILLHPFGSVPIILLWMAI